MSIEMNILNLLKKNDTLVFCIKDMLSFGDYKSVAKAIERLTLKGDIKRITHGIYYYPLINKAFNQAYPPEISDVAEAISRNNNWEIRETGSTALYKLGLDNQIPQKIIYLSSGPYRIYNIGNRTIEFRNSSQKNFKYSKKISLIVQAIKALGDENITATEILKLRKFLDDKEKEALLSDIKYAPVWMHQYIKDIVGEKI